MPLVGTVSTDQQPQVIGQAGDELVEAERGQAGSRQLDGQGDAIQLPADLGDLATLLLGLRATPLRRPDR